MGRDRCFIGLIALFLAFGCAATWGQGGPWPAFRHDPQHTGRSPYDGPIAGLVQWYAALNGPSTSSPAVAGGRVYAVGGGKLTAVTLGGAAIWTANCGSTGASSPAVAPDGTVYVASTDGNLYAFNPDGSLRWKRAIPGPSESSPVVAPDGTIHIGCGASKLIACRADGTVKFTYSAGGAIVSSPALAADGTIYFGCDDGGLYAVKSTGTLKWKFTTNPVGAVKSSPAVGSDGTVYFGAMNGYFHAVWPGGTQRWRFLAGGGIYSSPGIAPDGSIVFGSRDRYIYALNPAGTLRWKLLTGSYVDSSPAIDVDGRVYVGSNDGSVYAVNPDGTLSWATHVGTAVISSPALDDTGTLHVTAQEGSLCALRGDVTPPTTPIVTDDGDYTTSQTTLHAAWSSADSETGIVQFEYAIGTAAGAQDVVPFTNAGTATELTRTDLALANGGDYFVSVWAINAAGLVSATGSSDGIRVDTTPPTADSPKAGASVQEIRVRVTGTDPESGLGLVRCVLLDSPDLPPSPEWVTGEPESDIVFPGPFDPAEVHYVAGAVRNGAGMWSDTVITGPVRIDSTPPSTPVVIDDGDITSIPDCLHVMVSSSDPESGVIGYIYSIGTSPGGSDIVRPTSVANQTSVTVRGLQLVQGVKYYFQFEAVNGAGLRSAPGRSDGIEYRRGVAVWWKFRADAANTGRAVGAIPLTGIQRWRVQTGGYVESSAAIGGDGTVYAGSSDGKLYAISAAGTVRWTYQTASWIDSSPAIASDGSIHVGAYDGLYCVSVGGTLKWKYPTAGMIWSSPSIGLDGTVYFGCQDRGVYALNPNGTLKWSYLTGGEVWSSPAIAQDGTIHAASGDGKLYALNSNGTLRWTYQTGSAADSSPAIGDDGTVYFGSGDGFFYAVRGNGSLRWRIDLGQVVDSSAAVAEDGRIYVGTGGAGYQGKFHAITPEGTVAWQKTLPEGVRSSPAVDPDGNVCVGCANGRLYVYDRNGVQLWSALAGGAVLSSPAVGPDGALVIGSDDGCLHCFRDQMPLDTTPPTTPVVLVERDFITPEMPIAAWWSSSDPESGIDSYTYAIGTQPRADDVVSWTNAGLTASISRAGLPLVPGRSYYVSVRSTNGAGLPSEIGVSGAVVVLAGSSTIGGAKSRPVGTQVGLAGKVVTAVFEDCAFIESPDRSAGIRCIGSTAGLQAGSVVNVQGTVALRYGETVLAAAVINPLGFAGSVKPVSMPAETLVRVGLDPTGLLVRCVGRVVRVGTGYFIISDGSRVLSPRGVQGIEVRVVSQEAPAVGSLVAVNAVACRELVNSQATVVLRAAPGFAITIH